jgi:cadmium resistance protein CadD (predicted permease)
VTGILILLAATIGGAIGWWLGEFVGFMTAFFLSVVGMAAGIYIARKWAAGYIE